MSDTFSYIPSLQSLPISGQSTAELDDRESDIYRGEYDVFHTPDPSNNGAADTDSDAVVRPSLGGWSGASTIIPVYNVLRRRTQVPAIVAQEPIVAPFQPMQSQLDNMPGVVRKSK